MAVMTTQHSEGGLLDEKPIKMDTTVALDSRNGSLEVNGHVSPDKTQIESKSDSVSNRQDELHGAPEDTVTKQTQNQEAFASNQAVPEQVKDAAKEEAKEVKEATPEKVEQKLPVDAPAIGTVEDAPSVEKESVTEPATKPTEDSTTAPVVDSKLESDAPANREDAPEKAVPESNAVEHETSVPPPEKAPEAVVDSAPAEATESASDLSPVPEPKEDVAMTDAEPTAEPVATAAEPAESTQETIMSDAPPITPVDDGTIQAAGPSTVAKDAAEASPAEPITADTSMSDAPPPPVKVSRSRSPDRDDEPAAKRTKLENTADEVEVKTLVDSKPSAPSQDRMDIDPPSSKPSPYLENGEPKFLNHSSLNNSPITDFQARQLRTILALTKKTKAGAHFKLPVVEMWPGLSADYSAKVPEPTDISTMEKKLRGDLKRYATMAEFKADVDRLVKNSVIFNGEGHEVTRFARSTREGIYTRMSQYPAAEATKSEKKETTKQHPTRHTEVRSAAHPPPPPPPQRPPKPPAPSPPPKPVVESPAFAIPSGSNGVPLIRRDSTKGTDGRAKRPVKPAHSKDLFYDTKRKKKLSPELRFCEEVLTEIKKTKYYDLNAHFMAPVDPVALNIPSYHKIIKKPMDLSTMSSKLSAGEYLNAKEFDKDFDLIVKNCKTFNGDDHTVYQAALRLQNLYKKEMSRKDEWMAKHAPPTATTSQATTSPRPRDESEDEEPESEPEPEADAERTAAQQRINGFIKRLEEENKKINELINSTAPDFTQVEIAQTMVNMLQKQIVQERTKLAAMPPPKKPSKPSKPSKPKKSGAATGGSAGGNKKFSGAGASTGASSTKKASAKKPKRKMGALEKEIIAAGIAELEGPQLERAIDIIKTDTGQGENDSGELELDIEVLSEGALNKLYDIAVKTFPHLRAEKEKTFAAPPPVETPTAKSKTAAAKSKKNKPMSRVEQERRIQQLNDLRAQASRHGSGSQEPMESIEGNGRASVDPVTQPAQDSEDEESSEEE